MDTERQIIVFRHGAKETGPKKDGIFAEVGLIPEARKATGKIAALFKGKNISRIYTSPLVRAYQCGMIFSTILEIDFPTIVAELAGKVKKWAEVVAETIKTIGDPTALDFYNIDPQFVKKEGENFFKIICKIADSLPRGKQAIFISHGGLIEPAMAAAKAKRSGDFKKEITEIQDLKEDEGIVFKFDQDYNFVGVETI